ncbi:MAG: S8 family serine peptidase [Actinomycetota bacterium]
MNATLALRPMRRSVTTIVALAVMAATLTVAVAEQLVRVVVSAGNDRTAAELVTSIGGRVETSVPLIGGVVADVPESSVRRLSSIADVVPDRSLHVRSAAFEGSPATAFPYEVGATDAWSSTAGQGVGVALVDTGVAPVPDLLDRVVAVADLTPEHAMTDTFGHGTFMAGLVAGNGAASDGKYLGVAPKAHLVSVKVAVSDGSTTLGTVLAGLQLVDHSRARFNIRVLLLAMSSDTDVAPERDPLTRALRALWDDGIFVVVPAGNDGPDAGSVDSPGQDPVLMTAGAVDDQGTASVSDDTVPSWTSRGPSRYGAMKPDVAAPGARLVSLRAPGSRIDLENPSARVGEMYFRGSGTSMSSAVTTGAAALVASAFPWMDPDDIKQSLIDGATPLAGASKTAVGSGVVNAANSVETEASQAHGRRGRGGPPPGSPAFNGRIWDARVWDGRVWDGRVWDGRVWDGRVWDGRVWDGRVWDGRVWDGRVWDGSTWNSRIWG